MLNSKIKIVLKYLIGIFIIAYIISRSDAKQIIENFSGLNYFWLFNLTALWVAVIIIKSVLWKFYLRVVNEKMPFSSAFKSVCVAALIHKFLPGHIGSFSRPVCLKNIETRCSLNNAAAAITIEQLMTALFYFLALMSGGIIFLFFKTDKAALAMIAALAGLYFCALSLLWIAYLNKNKLKKIIDKARQSNHKFIVSFIRPLLGFVSNIGGKTEKALKQKSVILKGLAFQFFINLIFMALIFFCAFRAFGAGVDLNLKFLLIPCMAYSVSLLPVSPDGIGIVEWMGVVLFSSVLSYMKSDIVSAFLLVRFVHIAMPLLFGGVCYFLFIRPQAERLVALVD